MRCSSVLRRRRFFFRTITLGIMSLVASCVAATQNDRERPTDGSPWSDVDTGHASIALRIPEVPFRSIIFDTTEGTAMSIDVSPDGETLVFDLLGDIYSLPISGGPAVPLTYGRAWDQAPRFSPDGTSVYFISDRIGFKNIWRVSLADRLVRQVTRIDSDVVGTPNWSPDGSRLLASITDAKTRSSEFVLHTIDPNDGSKTPIDGANGPWIDTDTFERFRLPIRVFSGVESSDGTVFFSQASHDTVQGRSTSTVRLYQYDQHTESRTAITPTDASYSEYKPQLSHDGKLLAYFRQYHDRTTEIRILNRVTGDDDKLLELGHAADDANYYAAEDSTPNYAFSPDDRQLLIWHQGKIHRVDLIDGSDEIIPFRVTVEREVAERVQPRVQHLSDVGEAKIIRWPSLSNDGQTMAFAAIGYIWLMDVKSGTMRRLSSSGDFEYMPAISPDGKWVAYISFAKSNSGTARLMISDLNGGKLREVLAAPNVSYLIPKWSHDSSMIALIREVEGEGCLEATFGWTLVDHGVFHEVSSAPILTHRGCVTLYSRFVGFDKNDRNLLFSYPRSRAETVLASAKLDGSDQRILAIGTPEVGGITPAPDLEHVALTRDGGSVWVLPFSADNEQVEVSTLTTGAHQISSGNGYYVDWGQSRAMTFGFGQDVYRYRLDNGSLDSLRVKVAFSKPKATQLVAFQGARLITMSDDNLTDLYEYGTIMFDGQRIVAVGAVDEVVIPADALVVDARGKTIMPGLIDTHYHRIGGSGPMGLNAFKLPNSNFGDRSAITYGVTTAWEPGGALNDGVPATVDLQNAGRISGPRWSHSAVGAVGNPWELLTSYVAALKAVEEHRNLGVNVLKEYVTPTRQQRQWLSAAARETGVGIVSHLSSFDMMMTRIVDGYTGGDHPYIPVPFYFDVHEMLRQSGYIWTPNIRITLGTVGIEQSKQDYFCHAVLQWQEHVGSVDRRDSSYCPADTVSLVAPYDVLRFSHVAKQAVSAESGGVHIGVSAHNMPGFGLHQEMWYLRRGGMSVKDVLRATMIGNAEKLGLQEEIGSLEPGKIADFLVLDENPLDDVLNTLSLKYTVQGGVVYDSITSRKADLVLQTRMQ